jgi:hypothetical protein
VLAQFVFRVLDVGILAVFSQKSYEINAGNDWKREREATPLAQTTLTSDHFVHDTVL